MNGLVHGFSPVFHFSCPPENRADRGPRCFAHPRGSAVMRSKDSNAGPGGATKTYGFVGHKTCRAGSGAVAIMSQAWDGAGASVRCREIGTVTGAMIYSGTFLV